MHQHQRANAVEMIRMEVGEQQPAGFRNLQAHQRNVTPTTFANIHYEHQITSDHYVARPRAVRIGERGAGAAQPEMQSINKASHAVSVGILFNSAFEQITSDLDLEQEQRCYQQRDQSDKSDANLLEHIHSI
jgi:hypothetical protein